MRLKKSAAGVAALVLSTALIAGCGDKDEKSADKSKDPISQVQPASELTKDNFTEQMTAAMLKAGSAHMTMTMTGMGVEMTAEGDQVIGETPAETSMSMTMDMAGMQMDMRMIGTDLFMNLGAITQDKFVALDLTDTSDPLVEQFGQSLNQSDLSKQLEMFEGALTNLEKKDGEKIDGVDTQRYDVSLNAQKVMEASGTEVPSGADMPEEITYSFYVDNDNLTRRISMDLMGMQIQMDFTDWGKEVKIEKPSADQISDMDLSSMMSGVS